MKQLTLMLISPTGVGSKKKYENLMIKIQIIFSPNLSISSTFITGCLSYSEVMEAELIRSENLNTPRPGNSGFLLEVPRTRIK